MVETIAVENVSVSEQDFDLIENDLKILHCDVKLLRERTSMNRKDFANYFGIPYRTVEDWEHKKSNCSPYLFRLMYEKLLFSGFLS